VTVVAIAVMGDVILSRRSFLGVSLAATAAATGCGGNVESAFPPGLTPLREVNIPVRGTTPAMPYPENLSVESGNGEYLWGIGRGFVRAPLARVYEALQDPDVTTDRRRVSSYTVTPNTEPAYPSSYRVRNVVNDIITVEFDISFRLGPYAGTPESPTAYALAYQKTFGTTYIEMMRGSVLVKHVEQGITEIQMVRHVKAMQGTSEVEQYLLDVFDNIVARVNGRALPRFS